MSVKKTTTIFIQEATQKYGDQYDFSMTEYVGANVPVQIRCTKHDLVFEQTPDVFLKRSRGCPICSKEQSQLKKIPQRISRNTKLISQAETIHNNKYDYSLVDLTASSTEPVIIVCKEHGEFQQLLHNHAKGFGCSKCGRDSFAETRRTNSAPKFVDTANIIHNNKYQYGEYVDAHTHIDIECPIHGTFSQLPCNHLQGNGCPHCAINRSESKPERLIIEALPNIKFTKDQTAIGKEIDLFSATHKLGIEVNGVYWHNDERKPNNHLLIKSQLAATKGIKLLHFWDIEVTTKLPIITSMIKHRCGQSDRVIYARKCEIRLVDIEQARIFLDTNHMQGSSAIGSIRIGLFYCDELVSIMTFGKPRFNKQYGWELIRLCSKLNTTVVGAASKLLKYFKRNHAGSIISYANRRWSTGEIYQTLGFKLIGETPPNYWYARRTQILSRYACQKHKLPKLLGDENFDNTKSEYENMLANRYHRIFDAGNLVFVLT